MNKDLSLAIERAVRKIEPPENLNNYSEKRPDLFSLGLDVP